MAERQRMAMAAAERMMAWIERRNQMIREAAQDTARRMRLAPAGQAAELLHEWIERRNQMMRCR